MGRLKDAFKQIAAKNQDDSQIEKTLVSLKKDRDLFTHHKLKKITETRLRNNVCRHMWAIVTHFEYLSNEAVPRSLDNTSFRSLTNSVAGGYHRSY